MSGNQTSIFVGGVGVVTSDNGGLSQDQIAEMCVDKIISISNQTHPAIQQQAHAFREQLLKMLRHYINMAAEQDRATVCAKLREAGFDTLADQIRRI